VDIAKQRRLTGLAVYFLQQHRLLGQAARFDVLTVSWPQGTQQPAVTHYRNAFEAVGRFEMYQ
jgi:putative endonuclease